MEKGILQPLLLQLQDTWLKWQTCSVHSGQLKKIPISSKGFETRSKTRKDHQKIGRSLGMRSTVKVPGIITNIPQGF